MKARHAERLATAAFALGRALRRAVPQGLKARMEHRAFYAVHQLTRITNDDYVSDEVRARKSPVSDPESRLP
jgi:hypothetical protein